MLTMAAVMMNITTCIIICDIESGKMITMSMITLITRLPKNITWLYAPPACARDPEPCKPSLFILRRRVRLVHFFKR